MPANDWPQVPPFTAMDVWLHEALTVGIADNARLGREHADAEEQAEALAREAARAAERSIQNRLNAQQRRGGHKFYAAKRPWQAAGFSHKAVWEAAGKPGPLPMISDAEEEAHEFTDPAQHLVRLGLEGAEEHAVLGDGQGRPEDHDEGGDDQVEVT